jgi:sialidase-1
LPLERQDILIYSSPKDKMAEAGLNQDNPNGRDDIMVWASFDGAETWPVKRLIENGPAGYTWLAAGRNGTPSEGILYMLTRNNCLIRFNLGWLTEEIHNAPELE